MNLLFPGRHLAHTRYQENYLASILPHRPASIPGLIKGSDCPKHPLQEVIFAITSSNQENSRYNPIPFHIRSIGVDRFARSLQKSINFRYRIFGVPHYGQTPNFASFTLKEIGEQSEGAIRLGPSNSVVLCSTKELIDLYQDLGFSIAPAELLQERSARIFPIDLIAEIGRAGAAWSSSEWMQQHLAEATASLFTDFPEVPKRIARVYQDPLTNQEGGLTQGRNYNIYARGMNQIILLKYADIKQAILPGRIVDEGCGDGGLLVEISQDFRDSDLLGIDISAEFAHRFQERQRSGDFGGAYVHFFLRNLLDSIFEQDSIDTTICNSTLHELWSYADQEKTVLGYLKEKFRQLRPGGRLIIRDVVGPEEGAVEIFVWCRSDDGLNVSVEEIQKNPGRDHKWLEQLSTQSRFLLFATDYLPQRRQVGPQVRYRKCAQGGKEGFALDIKTAAEFLSKKDYVDNWLAEMHEEFCFWSFSQWKNVLTSIGFMVLENPNQPATGSRVYTNPWIVENRYQSHVELFEMQSERRLPYPPTNMVLVAEKPKSTA